jgi:hypothetical protein
MFPEVVTAKSTHRWLLESTKMVFLVEVEVLQLVLELVPWLLVVPV